MSDQKTPYSMVALDDGPPPPSNGLLTDQDANTTHSSIRLKLRQSAHKFWALEASASLVSLLIFVGIVVLLFGFDGTIYGDASTIGSNMTKRPKLFPILAFMSTVMRATMLLPVATAIGQLKWSWFRSPRRLVDMERFDDAARGFFGSAKLLFFLRFRSIAAVGAALTILALPLDAVIQTAIMLPLTTVPVSELDEYSRTIAGYQSEVFIERATSYTVSQRMTTFNDTWPATPMINAIMFGQGYTNGLSEFQTSTTLVDCPTGYCEFDNAQTLAITYQCVERTDIKYEPKTETTYAYQYLPGTDLLFFLDGNDNMKQHRITAESYSQWPDPDTYPDYQQSVFSGKFGPLIVRTAMMMNLGNGTTDVSAKNNYGTFAMECGLFWEVQTTQLYVNATDDISNGTLASRDSSVTFTYEPGNGTLDAAWLITPDTCIVANKTVPNDDSAYYKDNCIHLVGKGADDGLQNMLKDPTLGLMGDLFIVNMYTDDTAQWNKRSLFAINMEQASSNQIPDDAYNNIKTMWDNIAFAASYTIRRTRSLMNDGSRVNLHIRGDTYVLVFYYSVDWPRLGLPAFVVLCCALFVLYAALVTRHEYAWRRSALPLFFHGLEDNERVARGDLRDFNVMQDVAKDVRVRLTEHVDANGARFTTEH